MPLVTTAGRYLALIRDGRKTSTIRMRCRVTSGQPITFTNYRDSVRTRCVSVEQRVVDTLTDTDAQADGFADLTELLHALRQHYPTLSQHDVVSVIRFQHEEVKK